MTELKTIEVDGTKVKIFVTEKGDFQAQLDGVWVVTSSLKSLTEKVKTHVRNSRKIAVPVTLLDDFSPSDDKVKIQMVHLTGIHSGSGHVIAKDDKDGEVQQLRYFYGTCVRRLTDPEIKEFIALVRAQWEARRVVEKWVDEHEVNPQALIREAAEALDPARDTQTEVTE